jgi:N-acetylglucosaminyldiphosphoundecaprenol N-acetyl-beta-D-mannosaminyltransferase
MNLFQIFSLNEIPISNIKILDLKKYLCGILQNNDTNFLIPFNLDLLRISTFDLNFNDICKKATIIFPDGAGITSLLFLKYGKRIKRITGTDVFKTILSIAEEQKLKVALVGSSHKAQQKIIKKLNDKFPNIKVVSTISPPFLFEKNESENKKVIDELTEAKPDVLFLSLGAPRQEYWIENYKNLIGTKLNVCVGAVFDYFSGEKTRAPKFFQVIGLEWFWRLLAEPKRLYKRYIINDIPFYFKMLGQILKDR